jgi:urease accessory protein
MPTHLSSPEFPVTRVFNVRRWAGSTRGLGWENQLSLPRHYLPGTKGFALWSLVSPTPRPLGSWFPLVRGLESRATFSKGAQMLCDQIASRNDSDERLHVDDFLDLEWWELDRRAIRKVTRDGRELRVLLPLGSAVRHGDVLSNAQSAVRIQVCVKPCGLLIVRPRDSMEMGILALEIGNLHIPAEIVECTMRVIADGPAEEVVTRLGLPFEKRLARLHPRRCAGMPEIRVSSEFRLIER